MEGAEGEIGAQGEPAEPTQTTIEVPAPDATPVTAPVVKKPEPVAKSAKDQLTPAQRKAAIDALGPKVDEFYDPIVELSGATFESQAEKLKLKITTTELFTQAEPPKALDIIALNNRIGKVSDIAFESENAKDEDELVSAPQQTADHYIVIKLIETEASRPLTYEEAKVRATVDLKAQMAREQLKTEAETLHAKLVAGIAAEKSFEDAAKENDQKIEKLAGITIPPSRFGQPNVPPAFDAGRFTDPGTIADIKFLPSEDDPERALIVFVEKREVTVDDAFNDQLENYIKSENSRLRLATFQNWLKDRYTENGVEYYVTDEDQ